MATEIIQNSTQRKKTGDVQKHQYAVGQLRADQRTCKLESQKEVGESEVKKTYFRKFS